MRIDKDLGFPSIRRSKRDPLLPDEDIYLLLCRVQKSLAQCGKCREIARGELWRGGALYHLGLDRVKRAVSPLAFKLLCAVGYHWFLCISSISPIHVISDVCHSWPSGYSTEVLLILTYFQPKQVLHLLQLMSLTVCRPVVMCLSSGWPNFTLTTLWKR